jgi:glucosylceramidase
MLNIRQILNRKTLAILSSFLFIHSIVAQVSLPKNKVLVYTTSAETNLRISISDTLEFKPQVQPKETETAIFIDTSKTFQEIVGIGAAITDASAETFARVSAESQKKLLESFFHPQKGIGYSLIRTNMNSCDFSSGSYTYVQEGDKDLKTFNIAPDTLYKIPLIQKAFNMTNQNLKLFISPWSPPAFMKDNNNMLKGGKLLPMYYQSWANYYVKFINEYEKLGVHG